MDISISADLQAQQNEPHGDRQTPAPDFHYHGSMTAADNPLSLLHLGTSSFTAKGWEGTFYPKKTSPRQYLTYYAQHFDTLEVDATLLCHPLPLYRERMERQDTCAFSFCAKSSSADHSRTNPGRR